MIRKIDHIGIAVEHVDEQIPFYRDILGLTFEGIETIPDRGLKIAFFKIGEISIELIEPTDPGSTIAGFLKKRGPGIHHIAFGTDDIECEMRRIRESGIRLIDPKPKSGAHGTRVAFLHPKDTFRVLTELVEGA